MKRLTIYVMAHVVGRYKDIEQWSSRETLKARARDGWPMVVVQVRAWLQGMCQRPALEPN